VQQVSFNGVDLLIHHHHGRGFAPDREIENGVVPVLLRRIFWISRGLTATLTGSWYAP
jgi:hypothetical protein